MRKLFLAVFVIASACVSKDLLAIPLDVPYGQATGGVGGRVAGSTITYQGYSFKGWNP